MSKESTFSYPLNAIYVCYDVKDGRIINIHETEFLNCCKRCSDEELEDEILKLTSMITGIPKSEIGILKIQEELSSEVGYKVDTRKKELVTREDTRRRKK